MDKFIEIMALYLVDWQQTAIANTRYSVVLAVLAIFFGGIIITILKKKKIADLMQQVMEGNLSLEKAESDHAALLKEQEQNAEKLSDIQQQLEQSSIKLQQEREQHQSVISKKDELFIKSIHEKQSEIDAVNADFTKKNGLLEQVTTQLKEQQKKSAEYVEVQEKMLEVEKEASRSATELIAVKQQLKTEVNKKNVQGEQLDGLIQSANSDAERVAELEFQLEKTINTIEVEKMQQQLENQEQQIAVQDVELVSELENKIQQQNRQLEKFNEKLLSLVEQAIPVQQDIDSAAEQGTESAGFVSGVLGWFSSAGNNEKVNGELTKEEKPKTLDAWQKHQHIIDQLGEHLLVRHESQKKQTKDIGDEKEAINEKKPMPTIEIADETESSFSEKMAEVADKMDAFKMDGLQDKLKGYFNKLTDT